MFNFGLLKSVSKTRLKRHSVLAARQGCSKEPLGKLFSILAISNIGFFAFWPFGF